MLCDSIGSECRYVSNIEALYFEHLACGNELDGEIHCSICLGFHNKSHWGQPSRCPQRLITVLTCINPDQTCTTFFEEDLDTFFFLLAMSSIFKYLSSFKQFSNCKCICSFFHALWKYVSACACVHAQFHIRPHSDLTTQSEGYRKSQLLQEPWNKYLAHQDC